MANYEDNHEQLLLLHEGFDKILNAAETKKGITMKEWMNLNSVAHKLCTGADRHEPGLYGHIELALKANATQNGAELKSMREETLLKNFISRFSTFRQASTMVSNITHILARFWIPAQKTAKKDVYEVKTLSVMVWRDACFEPLKEQLMDSLLTYIEADRDGNTKDKTLVREYIEAIGLMGVDKAKEYYEATFEKRFIDVTKDYYLRESTGFFASHTISDYMTQAETRIKQEISNCEKYYAEFKDTKPRLEEVMNFAMIEKHMDPLQAEFKQMLTGDKPDDMTRFYFLLSRVADGLPASAKTFEEYISSLGVVIVKEQQSKKTAQSAIQNATAFVASLLDLFTKFNNQLESCFQKNSLFKEALDKAFVTIMNMNSGKFTISRLLNFYLDNLLKGKMKITDEEILEKIDKLVKLFSYFRDKDEFGEYARRGLCKRLLAPGSKFNESAEKYLITQLKATCGNAYTRHLQGMFTDAESDTVQRTKDKFIQHNEGSEKVPGTTITLSVQVLNECYWPISGTDLLPIPGKAEELNRCISVFEEFYKKEFSESRKLKWLYNHGTLALNASVGGRKREVSVTPLQGAILLCWNKADSLTLSFKDILGQLWPGEAPKSKLRLSKSSSSMFDIDITDVLKFAIQPLACHKACKLLTLKKKGGNGGGDGDDGEDEGKGGKDGEDGGESVSVEDSFTLNLKALKRPKTSFPAGSAKAQERNAKEDQKLVLKQRSFEIDAAMVRVMKTHNVLSWPELQVQVVNILKQRFVPSAKMMKSQLESLIERDFLDRDENDRTKIKYVA
ncbi:hypothetical protein QOT17_012758 [Balamuthia mandrillaris]